MECRFAFPVFLFLYIDIYRDTIYNKTKKKANFFTLNYRKSIYNESKYKKGAITMKVNKNMVSGNTAMLILKLISETLKEIGQCIRIKGRNIVSAASQHGTVRIFGKL